MSIIGMGVKKIYIYQSIMLYREEYINTSKILNWETYNYNTYDTED